MIQQTYGVAFVGSGSARLDTVLTNDQLAQVVDTSDEWIATRTGIRQRHIAKPSDSIRSLASEAAAGAIAQANLAPTDIDLILLATSTPDDLFGSACQIQSEIGATRAVAFDITAACSGFVFGFGHRCSVYPYGCLSECGRSRSGYFVSADRLERSQNLRSVR